VDLADAATAAMGELSPIATERGVSLEFDGQPTPVTGDFARLRQLAVILVDNAIRHAGGPAEVKVHVAGEGTAAVLQVEDPGSVGCCAKNDGWTVPGAGASEAEVCRKVTALPPAGVSVPVKRHTEPAGLPIGSARAHRSAVLPSRRNGPKSPSRVPA